MKFVLLIRRTSVIHAAGGLYRQDRLDISAPLLCSCFCLKMMLNNVEQWLKHLHAQISCAVALLYSETPFHLWPSILNASDWRVESPVLLKITKKMPLLLSQPSEPDCQNINIRNMSWRLNVWWLGLGNRERTKERKWETSGRPTLPGQGKFPTKVRWTIFVLLAHVNL